MDTWPLSKGCLDPTILQFFDQKLFPRVRMWVKSVECLCVFMNIPLDLDSSFCVNVCKLLCFIVYTVFSSESAAQLRRRPVPWASVASRLSCEFAPAVWYYPSLGSWVVAENHTVVGLFALLSLSPLVDLDSHLPVLRALGLTVVYTLLFQESVGWNKYQKKGNSRGIYGREVWTCVRPISQNSSTTFRKRAG